MYQILIKIVSKKPFQPFFSNQQLLNSKQNKTRSYIRMVHGIKHQETKFTIGLNHRKRPKIFKNKIQLNFKN